MYHFNGGDCMPVKHIPIFFTFDNNYVVPAAVAFWSLLNRAKHDVFYEMHVLHHDISDVNVKLLQSVVGRFKNAVLVFHNTGGFLDDEFSSGSFSSGHAGSRFTADTILRCFAARFFPQYDKIIYSDVDVVFMDDISEIYDIDLRGKYISGVRDPFMKYVKSELSHLKPEHYEMLHNSYIAGGIWVMNLKKIRADNLESRMLEIVRDDTIVKRFNDQDIMNIACENHVGFIPLNYISYPYLLDLLRKSDFISHYSRDEMFDSIINPKILHFAASKPWSGKPQHADTWWNIFEYLKLPRTSIFRDAVDENVKKYKKYKRLFNIALVISALSITLNILGVIL